MKGLSILVNSPIAMNVKALDNTTMAFEKYFGINVFTSLRDMTPKKRKKKITQRTETSCWVSSRVISLFRNCILVGRIECFYGHGVLLKAIWKQIFLLSWAWSNKSSRKIWWTEQADTNFRSHLTDSQARIFQQRP